MNKPSRSLEWLVWGGLALVIAIIMLAYWRGQLKLGGLLSKPLPVNGPVADFTLTNQNSRAISLADLRGHVWVADIIFTRCTGPCLKMTRQMKELERALPASSQARLVTLTTDPVFDNPAVLKRYAERSDADPGRWIFLTGTKQQIANLAIESLKLTAVEKKPEERESPEDLFIHSTLFVLVDKRARLRGIFQTMGEDIDPQKVKTQILQAVAELERER